MSVVPFSETNEPFPSIIVRRNSIEPRGAYAEAMAVYLKPDTDRVGALKELLSQKNVGIVAHFYMDPELQGVFSACDWPHIFVSDSLVMARQAVEMAKSGVKSIVVLGVDFMSENARAMLDAAGFSDVPVYRLADQKIGCSLADASASPKYQAYLKQAAETPNSLHVIYVNTGLDVKAQANRIVPTITCTSSNVVQVILQAAAQLPDINIWYGPDTYMGENLQRLFASLLRIDEYRIRELHPVHSHSTIRELLSHYHFYKEGACIVHELFGQEVVERIARDYNDAFLAVHLEVPGEMFDRALECQRIGTGVVGSTANILQFVSTVTKEAVLVGGQSRIQIILGTESGMVTSVVRRIQRILSENIKPGTDIAVEVIFPVANQAISTASDSEMKIVPGVSGSEGCSLAGGCAVCPYMKMNTIESLFDLLGKIDRVDSQALAPFEPRKYDQALDDRTAAQIGGETILHMQAFQESKMLSEQLIHDIRTRNR